MSLNKKIQGRLGALEQRLAFWCLILALIGLVLIFQLPSRIEAMENERRYQGEFKQFSELFSEIYGLIKEKYYTDVESRQLFEGAINGMFQSLDAHSSYLPPVAQEMLSKDTEGEYSGVGLHITLRDRILTVISPIAGSPAARAGIQSWDRIIEIDGKSTKDISLIGAVKKLTGQTGTKVKVTIWRASQMGEELEFEITREKIKIKSVWSKVVDDGIGYLRISKFQENTAKEVRGVLDHFNNEKVKGVIVDLRYNAGGLLDRAVEICDLFLEEDQLIVSIRGRTRSNMKEFFSLEPPTCNQPLVVLVNNGSASASEIFAGAVKDTNRGVIIGSEGHKGARTFGKGSVQTISNLKHALGGSAGQEGEVGPAGLRLTTARYYTPSGESIHEKGITPDISVQLPDDHEGKLFRRGLLGDPSMIEPDDGSPEAGGEDRGQDPPDETGGEDKGDEVESLVKRLMKKDDNKAENDEIRDILLDEGIKYMKAILIYSSRKAA